jgi:tripartite-type tricarboxylate transporter receptor subunit TctC
VAFEKATGAKLKKLDASSGGDKAIGVISGQMETFFTTYSPVKDYVESGKMRVLGVIGDERSSLLPDVPTFKECGIDMGDEFNQAYCIYVHKDTPDEIVKIMQDAVVAAMADEQTIQDYTRASFIPEVLINEDLDEYLKSVWDFCNTLKDDVMSDSF